MDIVKVTKTAVCNYALEGFSGAVLAELCTGFTVRSVILIPTTVFPLTCAHVAAMPFTSAYLVYKLLPRSHFFSPQTRGKIALVAGCVMLMHVTSVAGMTLVTGVTLNVLGLAGAFTLVFVTKKAINGFSRIHNHIIDNYF